MNRHLLTLILVILSCTSYAQDSALINRIRAKEIQTEFLRNGGRSFVSRNQSIARLMSTGPEQDCNSAIPVCALQYNQNNSYSGEGSQQEIPSNSSCLGSNEKNSVWYIFTVSASGTLAFNITPNAGSNDDYDFALYNISGSNCSGISSGAIAPIRCNFSATGGVTGLSSSGSNASEPASGPNQSTTLGVTVGQTYVLILSNYSSTTTGYQLDFTPSSADIHDIVPPTPSSVTAPCGTTNITFNVSEAILCNTISASGSEFTVTGTGGPYTVTSASGLNCGSATPQVSIVVSPALSGGGPWTLSIASGSDGNTLIDNCNNPMAPTSINFNQTPTTAAITGDNNICKGETTGLTASNGSSWAWTGTGIVGPTNTQTISVSPATPGNYTYNVTISNGSCGTSSASFALTVKDAAVANFTFPASICAGTPVTFTNTTVLPTSCQGAGLSSCYPAGSTCSGIFTCQATPSNATFSTYIWSFGDGGISTGLGNSASFSPSHTYTNPGTYTIVLSANVPLVGCGNTVSQTITVLPGAASVTTTGTATICSGASTPLTSSVAGNWTSSPAGFTATNTAAVSVSPTVTTTYTVTVPACGGGTTTGTVTVTVNNPNVTVSPQLQTTCPGTPVTITSSTAGDWTSIPAGFTATNTASVSVSPSANTQYIVSSGAGACADTAIAIVNMGTFNVTVTPQLQSICSGSSATITASSAGNWTSMPPGYTATNTNTITVSPTSNIAYIITAGSGICTDTAIAVVAVTTFNETVTPQLQSVCSGVNATITSSTAGNWTSIPAGFTATNTNSISVAPTVSTQYIVTATSGICTDTAIAQVNIVQPNFTLTPSATQTSCVGNTGSVSVAVNPAGAYTYAWVNAASTSVGATSSVNSLAAGTYTVTVTKNGCVQDTTATVTLPPNPTMVLVGIPIICAGDTSGVIASGVDSITVSPMTGVLGIVDSIAIIKPTITATYTITGYNTATRCSTQQTFTITVNPKPVITSISIQAATCGQADGSITLTTNGTNTYSWNTTPVQTGASANNLLAGNYTVTITGSPSGCTLDSVINVPPGGAVTLAVPTGIEKCPTDTVILSLAAGNNIPNAVYTYSPTTGVTNLSANGDSVLLTPTTTTTYTVTVTSNGCTDSKPMTVTVNPLPNIALTVTNASCGKNNGSINSIVTNGSPTYAYQWISAANPNFSNASSVTGLGAGTYGLFVIDSKNCWDTATVSITNTPAVNVTVSGNDTTLCSGSFSVLTSNGGVTYTWYPSTGLSGTSGSSVIATPNVTTVYHVIGHDAANVCSDTANIMVQVNPMPTVNITPTNPVICADSLLTLNVTGASNYAWTPTASLPFISANGSQVIATPAVTTTYTVYGTNAAGCIDSATFQIVVIPRPVANAGPDLYVCPGQPITLTGSGGTTYTWSPPTYLSNVTGATTVSTPAGNFIYMLTAINGSCYSQDTVTVFVYPKTDIVAQGDTTLNIGDSQTISVFGGLEPYTWNNTSSLSCGTCQYPIATPKETMYYTVSYTDTNGCVSIDSVLINVTFDYAIYAPNAFTLNGDNLNGKFVIYGFGIQNYTLRVFDRWGNQVFNQSYGLHDISHAGWDGNVHGKEGETDVYVWTVDYVTTGNVTGKKIGSVTLLK